MWRVVLILCFCSTLSATSISKALTNRAILGKWRIMEVRIDGIKLKKVDKNFSFLEFSSSAYNLQGKYHISLGCDRYFGRYQFLEQGYLVINKGGIIPEVCRNGTQRENMLETQAQFTNYFFGRFKISSKEGFFLLENPRLEIWMIPYKEIEEIK